MTASDIDTAAVFAAALQQPGRHTNLGYLIYLIRVGMDDYTYVVDIVDDEPASIVFREGPQGVEGLYIDATPEQDRALREAHAMR